jgi:hypothetical protein
LKLGIVVHSCNPSYSGSRDNEVHGSRKAQTKVLQVPAKPLKAEWGVCACHLNYEGSVKRRILVRPAQAKVRPFPKNN